MEKLKIEPIKINFLIVLPTRGKYGAAALASAYRYTINSLSSSVYISSLFNFIIKKYISLEYFINFANKSNNLVWFLLADYISYIVIENLSSIFMNTIYGPIVAPKRWKDFPINNTYEANWSYKINKMFAYIVQSHRVKEYLIQKSKNGKKVRNKYIVSHGCLYINNSFKVMKWNERTIDVLIYIKFADINMDNKLQSLLKQLNIHFSVNVIRYGNHTKQSLLRESNNSKILVYFSYYDCWPSALMEMMNMGIFPIVQHCEFISKYGLCIKNFDIDFYKFVNIIHDILDRSYNTFFISKYYGIRNNCSNVLLSTLCEIYSKKVIKITR